MDFPFLLLVLLALPIVTAIVIVGVSAARRKSRAASDEPEAGDAHRLQADTAAVQDATDHPAAAPREAVPGRELRAASAPSPTDD